MKVGVESASFFVVYPFLLLTISFLFRRRTSRAQQLLHAHRSISVSIISLAFLATNFSALEVVGMIALAARYGLLAVHFYWIGAIPALAFLLLVLLPRYHSLRLRSIPEFLGQRFTQSTRTLSSISFTCLMVALAGITLGLASRILHLVLGLNYTLGICGMASIAAVFLLIGGIHAVIYAEVLQLVIFLLVLVPLSIMTIYRAHGIFPIIESLPPWQRHAFSSLSFIAPHDHLDLLGIVVGLGVCLSFSYWCSDFILVQRLCAAFDDEMLRTPRFTILAKLVMPLVVILPGLGLAVLVAPTSIVPFDLALPLLLRSHYPMILAVLALSTLCASCFMGICSNLIAAAAVYSANVVSGQRPFSPWNERALLFVLCLSSVPAGLLSLHGRALMELIQLAFSALNVPVACVLFAGIFWRRVSPSSGTPAIIVGSAAGIANLSLGKLLNYGSPLAQGFYGAILSCLCSLIAMALMTALHPADRRSSSVVSPPAGKVSIAISASALTLMVVFYVIFR